MVALPLDEVVDPTGAGDSFAGGFMGYLASQPTIDLAALQGAMVVGTVAASVCVEGFSVDALERVLKHDVIAFLSACEELLGMPQYQVTKFQAMAPIRAPNTTCASTTPASAMPLPTVAATLRWKMKIAMKLKNAANNTACAGFKTPVETTVAMELAAS